VELITGLNPWEVTMANGSALVIRASGYTDIESERVFTALVDATTEEQASLDVISRTPPIRCESTLHSCESRSLRSSRRSVGDQATLPQSAGTSTPFGTSGIPPRQAAPRAAASPPT
jgi:hypothetical protein